MGNINNKGYLIHNKDFHNKNESHSKLIFNILCQVINKLEIIDDGVIDRYKYDVEIFNYDNFASMKVELENRSVLHFNNIWDGIYDSLDIPERKLHYGNESDIYLVTCDKYYFRFMLIKDFQNVLKESEIYTKYNRYTKHEENFIKISLDKIIKIDINKILPAQKKKYKEILKQYLETKKNT